MMFEKVVKKTNTQLDRAKDFRYLALLGSFILLLDLLLVYRHDMSITELSVMPRRDSLPLGEILIFIFTFVVFVSWFTALMQTSLRIVFLMIPASVRIFFAIDKFTDKNHTKNTARIDKIRWSAVKNDNRSAFEYVKDFDNLKEETELLYYYSLSILLSMVFSFIAHIEGQVTLVSKYIAYIAYLDSQGNRVLYLMLSNFSYIFILVIAYLALFRGCAGYYSRVKHTVYFPEHGFD